MLANFHTHSTFCDGKNTPEEMVLAAISQGFSALGFSGHGTTDFDLRYCMRDMPGYREEIRRLQEKYAGQIQIFLGIEEDAFAPVDRNAYDYIIGSAHYIRKEDAEMQDILMCVQMGKTLDDPGRMRFEGGEFYVKRTKFASCHRTLPLRCTGKLSGN